jgi:hypothetical protein
MRSVKDCDLIIQYIMMQVHDDILTINAAPLHSLPSFRRFKHTAIWQIPTQFDALLNCDAGIWIRLGTPCVPIRYFVDASAMVFITPASDFSSSIQNHTLFIVDMQPVERLMCS